MDISAREERSLVENRPLRCHNGVTTGDDSRGDSVTSDEEDNGGATYSRDNVTWYTRNRERNGVRLESMEKQSPKFIRVFLERLLSS